MGLCTVSYFLPFYTVLPILNLRVSTSFIDSGLCSRSVCIPIPRENISSDRPGREGMPAGYTSEACLTSKTAKSTATCLVRQSLLLTPVYPRR